MNTQTCLRAKLGTISLF